MAVGNITNVIPASELPVMAEEEFLANVTVVTVDGTGRMKQIPRPALFNTVAAVVQKGDKGDTGATGLTGPQGIQGPAGPQGPKGDTGSTGSAGTNGAQGIQGFAGWTPVFSVVARGSDQVLQVINWTNPNPSATNKPNFPVYVGSSGFTTVLADAVNIKGPQGTQGLQGIQGANGTNGNNGSNGWSPVVILKEDTTTSLVYFYLNSWVGGTGIAPSQIGYISSTGITTDPVAGSDIGSLPISVSFNDILDKPTTLDGYGIVADTDDISEGTSNLYHTQARVRDTTLTGLSLANSTDVVNTDTVLVALGKLQAKFDTTYNEAGQVKVNYTGLTLSNFTANTYKTFNIISATTSLSGSPTTTYPHSTPNNYAGVFDGARGNTPNGRLIENPIGGQVHAWRIQGSYSGKSTGGSGVELLYLRLRNPVSGFQITKAIVMPNGLAATAVYEEIITIADTASIPSPNGYVLEVASSVTDAGLTVQLDNITRISYAVEINK